MNFEAFLWTYVQESSTRIDLVWWNRYSTAACRNFQWETLFTHRLAIICVVRMDKTPGEFMQLWVWSTATTVKPWILVLESCHIRVSRDSGISVSAGIFREQQSKRTSDSCHFAASIWCVTTLQIGCHKTRILQDPAGVTVILNVLYATVGSHVSELTCMWDVCGFRVFLSPALRVGDSQLEEHFLTAEQAMINGVDIDWIAISL